jgi:formylmethanofuran dehydrogenase subunit E
MSYTDDPVADFRRHDARQQAELKKLPVCSECGQPIQDYICYEINGELICPDCMEQNHRRWTEDVSV